MARPGGAGPVALRLALAFVGVALAAVALLAGLTAAFVAADVSRLVTRQQADMTRAVAGAAGAAWDSSDSWTGADLSPVLDLAARVGADVQVRDRAGTVVSSSPGFPGMSAARERREAGDVRGERAGLVTVRFSGSGLGGADEALRADLWRAIAGAAGLAALLALLVALAVSRRIASPVARLIQVAKARGGGDRQVRAGMCAGPPSCGTWRSPLTRWPSPWPARKKYGAIWSPTSRMSCAHRLPCCRQVTKPCWTA